MIKTNNNKKKQSFPSHASATGLCITHGIWECGPPPVPFWSRCPPGLEPPPRSAPAIRHQLFQMSLVLLVEAVNYQLRPFSACQVTVAGQFLQGI